jgi:MFS transporter, DHA1 family, tetracycline resistance protein
MRGDQISWWKAMRLTSGGAAEAGGWDAQAGSTIARRPRRIVGGDGMEEGTDAPTLLAMRRIAPSLLVVFITIFLDVLGIGIIIPVGPKLVAMVQGLPPSGKEEQTSLVFGLLAATYAAMMFVFSPILGSLSDQFGRRPVILIALLGSGIDYFAAAASPSIRHYSPALAMAALFVTRAINGLTGANISACTAYIADITTPEKRSAAFGVIGGAFGLGFAFGPLLGGVLGDVDIRLPFVAAGTLTLLNVLYGFFVLPESLPADRRRAFSWAKANALGALHWLTHHRVVATLAGTLFLLNVAQFSLHATWVLSMGKRLGWDTFHVGLSMCIVGVAAMVVQGGLARRVIPKLGERACLLSGILIGVLAFIGYGLANQSWMVYSIIAVASLGGIAGPAAQGIMSKAVAPTEQGLLQGALAGLNSIAGVVGYLLGGETFAYFASPKSPVYLPGATFLMGSVIMLVSIVPVAMIWKRMPTSVKAAPNEEAVVASSH